MYERMLDKRTQPTFAEMTAYCGEGGQSFAELNAWLAEVCATAQAIVFPYGNQYGWGVAHRLQKRLICNIFAENGAFTVMMRLSDGQFQAVYGKVSAYAQGLIDGKYPCGDGGWVHFRVLNKAHLDDVQALLSAKCSRKEPA